MCVCANELHDFKLLIIPVGTPDYPALCLALPKAAEAQHGTNDFPTVAPPGTGSDVSRLSKNGIARPIAEEMDRNKIPGEDEARRC